MAGTGTQNLTGTVINANITAQGGILNINNSSLAYSGIITMAGGTLDFTSATLGANAVLNMNGTGVLKNAAIDGAKLTYTESGSSFTKENVTFTSGTIDIGGALDSLVEGEQGYTFDLGNNLGTNFTVTGLETGQYSIEGSVQVPGVPAHRTTGSGRQEMMLIIGFQRLFLKFKQSVIYFIH